MSVATGGSEAAAAGGGGGGGRVFFQSPRGGGGGSGREDAVSAAAVQVQQRRHQQGKVTVKYDRKELRKRLVLEEWIVEQLGQLYGCQVRGRGAGCPARLPQSPRPPRAPGPPTAASGRRPRRGAPSRSGAPRGRLRQGGEEGWKESRGGGRRRSASCPVPARSSGGRCRWSSVSRRKEEGRERENCELRYGRTYCI
uniref:Protein phosphatase 1 regulatory inhibitor subunit 14C n=1 Tax=Pavo cristatus TaxID=9049 RepID=A0A8C9F905_PAVCR